MSNMVITNWWAMLIRGIVAVLLGLMVFFRHGIKFNTLVLVFSAYALVDGLVAFAGAVRAVEAKQRWWPLMIEGVAGLTTAIVTVAWPTLNELALVYIIAAWGFVTGLLEIASGLRLRKYVAGEWLLTMSGVTSIALGFFALVLPLTTPTEIALWVGGYALAFGTVLIALGIRLRSWVHR
jgi:uncharacterized membrane protein HdeD (DUF308 family)